MLGFIALILSGLVTAWLYTTYRSFARNLAAAKASGIPYIITPVYLFNTIWLLLHRPLMRHLRKLPQAWTFPWLDVLTTEWGWVQRYELFRKLETDTFLTVAPGTPGIMLWTADATAISQITTRRNDFPKPIHMYRSVDIFGKNVVSTEGQVWRHHRKVVSPPFTEKNNHLVWSETLVQAQDMLKSWIGTGGVRKHTVKTVGDDAMRLSLHVISRAGFGVQLQWPGIGDDSKTKTETEQKTSDEKNSPSEIDEGHTLNYTDALQTLLHNLLWVMLLPRFLLNNLPIKRIQTARESYVEWGKYMNEMLQLKKADFATGKETEGLDLMGALVKGAGITPESLTESPSLEKGIQPSQPNLTEQEILGNSFVFILAGHETAANSIHFSLIYLASNPSAQRRLQADLDSIFRGRPISEWDYERDLPKLFSGMAGAVLNEELRLVPPVVNIPKSTLPDSPQPLMLEGKKCTVPGNVLVNLVTTAAHRNPKYWPAGPPSASEDPTAPNDLEEFKPERWFADQKGHAHGLTHDSDEMPKPVAESDDLNVNTATDTSAAHFQPPRGAYVPFSEGYRACIGRRFAQVEILVVLAVVFSQYSVELAVDEWASDAEVDAMDARQRRALWETAKRSTAQKMRGLESIITLQMRREKVALRVVKRGGERFGV
ncbi:hypothetical protein MMC26_007340 [Xylographa opegraphella]|nr:hypothetical protein [Xylographa opegraphella]